MEKDTVPGKETLNTANKVIILNLTHKFKAISSKFPEIFGGIMQGNMSHSLYLLFYHVQSPQSPLLLPSLSDLPHFLSHRYKSDQNLSVQYQSYTLIHCFSSSIKQMLSLLAILCYYAVHYYFFHLSLV